MKFKELYYFIDKNVGLYVIDRDKNVYINTLDSSTHVIPSNNEMSIINESDVISVSGAFDGIDSYTHVTINASVNKARFKEIIASLADGIKWELYTSDGIVYANYYDVSSTSKHAMTLEKLIATNPIIDKIETTIDDYDEVIIKYTI